MKKELKALEKHAESVFFRQRGADGKDWKDLPYWDGHVDFKGCGLCSFAMGVDIVTGRDLTPRDIYWMRNAAGIDQLHTVTKDGRSCCGGDAQEQFNAIYGKLFGIKCREIPRSSVAFRDVLEGRNAVIWASSNNTEFHLKRGWSRYAEIGHVVLIWKYEDGIFYIKDPSMPPEEANNVPYTEEQMQVWLDARTFQQIEITSL